MDTLVVTAGTVRVALVAVLLKYVSVALQDGQ
jgi:hypothetical protein